MRVAICGAGIAGLTLANRLSALGADVVMLERSRGPRPQGYMIDFFGPGYDTAEAMGLLPAIENVAYRIEEATLVDGRGRRRAAVRPSQFAAGPLLDVMRPDLEHVLREHLPPEVDLRFGTSPMAVIDVGDAVRVTLDDGAQLYADLVVGADGLHSTVRQLLFGEESQFPALSRFSYRGVYLSGPGNPRCSRGPVLPDRLCRPADGAVCAARRSRRCLCRAPHRGSHRAGRHPSRAAGSPRRAGMGRAARRLNTARRTRRCTTTRWPRS